MMSRSSSYSVISDVGSAFISSSVFGRNDYLSSQSDGCLLEISIFRQSLTEEVSSVQALRNKYLYLYVGTSVRSQGYAA